MLPSGLGWKQIYGAALLAGIGFAMSLYVTALALPDLSFVRAGKLESLFGSAVSVIVDLILFKKSAIGSMRERIDLMGYAAATG